MKKNTPFKVILKNYYLFIRDFFTDLFEDKLGHYAASLSWSTLFSIIPLLAILLAIFTNLPIFDTVYSNIENLIFSNLMPTDSKEAMEYINTFIANSGKLGAIGGFYVIFASIMFFKNYDYIVNDIFDVPTRSVLSAVKTYLLLLLIIPAMMGGSFYISMFIQSYLDKNSITSTIHLYTFIPYFIVWMMFYAAYQLSANTRIDIRAALISSFIASLIWYLSKNAFIFYVVHNKTYASIYGGISTLLFFFLWIYISWAIFIHGLKFCDLLNRDEEIEHI
ncbi:YihY family inner membrane protein [Sulfurovum sp.]|uniref:YihY family inner membrane protein n=1 Tax=Sulfurovum sp. TaxID=1969726 RepID=UPI0025DF4929|nr:YihY family inner membrane protein [Sulfurovum sp.]